MEDSNKFLIPIAIVIAGGLIAWGLMSGKTADNKPADNTDNQVPQITINANDHILGNPDAPITIVEYSDLECPYCKIFNETTQKIVDEYGKDGKVAIVFRHFPIAQLHTKSRQEAIATECANKLGGNDKFWQYMEIIFERTPSNNGFDLTQLPAIAEEIGLNKADFTKCLDDKAMGDKVDAYQKLGVEDGVQGTPQSFIITKDGTIAPINGAQPYETVKAMIDTILSSTAQN